MTLVHASRRAGAEIVPLNWRLSAAEIEWQVRAANVTTLFVDEARRPLAEQAVHGLRSTIYALRDLETVINPQPSERLESAVDLSRPAAVLFTSGTSGRPRGALLTHGNFWFSAIGSLLHLGQRADDVWLAALPLFHIGGLSIVQRACIGALPVILQETFDPGEALAAVDAGATHISVVPMMLRRMLDSRAGIPWPRHVRCILLGGAPAPKQLVEECIQLGLPIAPTYGLTEAASQVTTLTSPDVASHPGSSGLPLPTMQVRVFRSSGDADPNEIGEIEIRGPAVFAGYLGDDPDTRCGDQWFRTGDVGFLDNEGFLDVVDRRVDLIISGGENIYPAEIEAALLEHPSVTDAGVIGVANDQWGARPVAGVVWQGVPSSTEFVLREFLRARLAAYKIPDRIVVLGSLPRSTSGKLLRRELRTILAQTEPNA